MKDPVLLKMKSKGSRSPGRASCCVVGIGSSAGGLEALRSLFGALQPTGNLSFVVVQHLSPVHRSRLVELIGHSTNLQVKEVASGTQPKPGIVYITPPNKDVRIVNGKLLLQKPTQKIGPKPSVDLFFRSLAEDAGENAVGIVLSGTGSDGSVGIRTIKSVGGLTISQKTGSAKYDGMPKSAAHTGMVDLELTPEEIARELAHIDKHGTSSDQVQIESENAREPFRKILEILTRQTGVSFDQYKQTTIRRRVERRISANQCKNAEEYANFLENNPDESKNLIQDILISVTSFFRDADSFRKLSDCLHKYLEGRKSGGSFRAWVVGCATGEEAYSVAMVLSEAFERKKLHVRPQVFATDLDESALEFARKGSFPKTAFLDFPAKWQQKYFTLKEHRYHVKQELRDMVIFAKHNITEDPPFLDIELLTCRNVMIYFNGSLQERVLRTFQYALRPQGLLFLGRSESVPGGSRHFEVVDKIHRVYQRNSSKAEIRNVSARPQAEGRRPSKSLVNESEDLFEALVQGMAPDSVMLDADFNVKRIFGDVGSYLELPKGAATQDVTKLLPPPLSYEALALLRQAQKTGRKAEGRVQAVKLRGRKAQLRLTVIPLTEKGLNLFLIGISREATPRAARAEARSEKGGDRHLLRRLQQELEATRSHLQTVIEEQETSNEELQAMNEELQSANEELQSTNEELETTNEELQSTNEELLTLNEEVNTKSAELTSMNLELQASQNAVSYPLLVLDRKKHLVRFNSAARHLFRLGEQDLGAPLNPATDYVDFLPVLKIVDSAIRKGGETKEQYTALNRTFSVEVQPIRNRKSELEMLVVSFVEITEIVFALEESRLNRDRLSSILENTLAVVAMKDVRGVYLYANRKFYEAVGKTAKEVIGNTDEEIFGKDAAKHLVDRDFEVLHRKGAVQSDDVLRLDGNELCWASSRFPLFDGQGRVQSICLVAIDITDRLADQRTIAKQQEELAVYGKFSTIAEIAAGIAHEVNTPLNVIVTKNDLLRKLAERGRLDEPTVKRMADDVDRMARNISSIVLGLKSVVAKDSDTAEKASLQKIVQDALKICEFRIQRHSASVNVSLPSEPLEILCYPVQIMQILVNLINNSLDAMKGTDNRWIKISFFETEHELCLRLTDAGPGIPEELTEKIMTPFFTTKKAQHGTGIGLSLSRSIARRHGGDLELDRSQPNTSFVLRLPREPVFEKEPPL